jgi:hypothetical protein
MQINALPKYISVVIAALSACADHGPVDCRDPALAASFDRGFEWSEDLTGTATREQADFEAMENEESARCALAGVSAGLRNVRGGAHAGGNCCRTGNPQGDGRAVGEVAAALYCDLSIALGGLGVDELLEPAAADACSRTFESACRSAFDRAARGIPNCRQFTRAEFREAYEVARFNQCVFAVREEQLPTSCTGKHCQAHCQGKFGRCGRDSHACVPGCRR